MTADIDGTSALGIKNPEAVVSRRCYDPVHRRLIYIGREATPEFWDILWNADEQSIRKTLERSIGHRWLVQTTRRFLQPEDGLILEGGCGMGQYVAALQRDGYRAMGIDSAPQTVALLNRVAPELNVKLGDVRQLKLESESVAGYWSLGVIEHFYEGFDAIATEMARVIQPGGYLFLTFPCMSPVRRLRARFGGYEMPTMESEPQNFYQFALDPRNVTDEFGEHGFQKVAFKSLAGLKGCKDEVELLRAPLQRLYNYPGRSIALRGVRLVLDSLLASLGAGHSCLLVMKRT